MRKNILSEVKLTPKQKTVLGGIAQDIFRDMLVRKPGGGMNSALLAVYCSGLSHGQTLTIEEIEKGKVKGLNL